MRQGRPRALATSRGIGHGSCLPYFGIAIPALADLGNDQERSSAGGAIPRTFALATSTHPFSSVNLWQRQPTREPQITICLAARSIYECCDQ